MMQCPMQWKSLKLAAGLLLLALSSFGRQDTEASLRRLRKFNRTWKSRGQELRQIPNMPRERHGIPEELVKNIAGLGSLAAEAVR